MTFSILARDPKTGHLGVATATGKLAVGAQVPHLRTGIGAIATQGYTTNPLYAKDGFRLLETGQQVESVVDQLRLVKSALEMDYTRRAAKASDAGMMAAIEAIGDGATDYEVAGECQRAMCLAGSEYPGFGPFIRPTTRLGEEHTTWRGETFVNGDAVFLELGAAFRKYQAPMGRLVYVGSAPRGVKRSVEMAIEGMAAIAAAIVPGGKAGDAYAAWRDVARKQGLSDYERHHCGYLVGIGFPPSWTGGSMVTGLAPNAELEMKIGMSYHLHSWFTDTDCVDYFIVHLTDRNHRL